MNKIFLYFNTIKYLKFSQIFWRCYYNIFCFPRVCNISALPIRKRIRSLIKPIEKKSKLVAKRSAIFLHEQHDFIHPEDWNNEQFSKLWLYNLHYFDDLNCELFQARSMWHQELIRSWIAENPLGVGNGWESYTISLRIVNWIKWSLSGNKLEPDMLASLATQTRYLVQKLEFHLLGNHLFANAKALIYAGLFFNANEADLWFKRGVQIIERQLVQQILPDGGNFELSPMYHAIFLEDILDLINIYNCYAIDVPEKFTTTAQSMLLWLQAMTHPNGEISFFNDAANGISATTEQLANYAKRLDFNCICNANNLGNIIDLIDSGYVRIAKNAIVLIADLSPIGADYIPGHAHADTLSFECSLFNKKVIVNSGTSMYGISDERLRQRSTKAHSTLIIDDKNSSEVWSGFRVARRVKIIDRKIEQKDNLIIASASHDGYCRLQRHLIHHREWKVLENSLEVIDRVTGNGTHKIDVIYHFAPEIKVEVLQINKSIRLSIGEDDAIMQIEGSGTLFVESSTYHPEFGLSIANKKIIYSQVACTLPFVVKMTLSW